MKTNINNNDAEQCMQRALEEFVNPNKKRVFLMKAKYFLTRFLEKQSDLNLETYSRIESKRSMHNSRKDLL